MTNIGAVFKGIQNLMARLPNIERIGVGVNETFIVFRFTWKPRVGNEFVVSITELQHVLDDQAFEDFVMEKMENSYKLWEVGEE